MDEPELVLHDDHFPDCQGDPVDILPDAVMKLYKNEDSSYRARFRIGDGEWLETDVPPHMATMIPLLFNQLSTMAE